MLVHQNRPRLLDLFCGAGGCSVGYHRAGFAVVGVDLHSQPNYFFDFHKRNALDVLEDEDFLTRFDAIHASPPCQAHVKGLAAVNVARGRELAHTDLIAATRDHLLALGVPFVIENVEGSPLRNPTKLCGSSFGLAVRRHRLFETSFPLLAPPCAHHLQAEAKYPTNYRPNGEIVKSKVVQVYGNAAGTELWPDAMGIDWMTTDELREAIPPAYTQHVGAYLMAAVKLEVAA